MVVAFIIGMIILIVSIIMCYILEKKDNRTYAQNLLYCNPRTNIRASCIGLLDTVSYIRCRALLIMSGDSFFIISTASSNKYFSPIVS